MNAPVNPFRASMSKLWFPPGMATSVNVGGFEVQAEEDGSIEVPKEHVSALVSHGMLTAPPAVAEAKKK